MKAPELDQDLMKALFGEVTPEEKRNMLRKNIKRTLRDALGYVYRDAATSGLFTLEELDEASQCRGEGKLPLVFALIKEAKKIAADV